ncbi:MAG TPA: LemA family protein, partial [Candidatus Nanoarchaeia archaeon]|nr:LemA family protein [Candidatus Nanoarchaeia archaeon]
MSKIKPLWIVIGVVVLILLWVMGSYNGLVNSRETVDQSWADVEAQYQRRLDLIPNLVSTVEGAVDFEKETQTQIAALRTSAQSAKTALANAQTGGERIAAVKQAEGV